MKSACIDYIEIGKRIKQRRKELKKSQESLGESVGISSNHVSSIENGKQSPSLETFILICDSLEVSPDYLLLGTMHGYNLPQDILEALKLCKKEDVELVKFIVFEMIKRNSYENEQEHYFR